MPRKLRTKSGCLACRRRRKKCDEGKPVCEACARLRIACTWQSDEERVTAFAAAESRPEGSDSAVDALIHTPLRSGDYRSLRMGDDRSNPTPADITFDETASVFERGRRFPILATDFAKSFDVHIIISGVFHGWSTIRQQFGLDCQWDALIDLDKGSELCGHGPVARSGSLWCWRMTMRVSIRSSTSTRADD